MDAGLRMPEIVEARELDACTATRVSSFECTELHVTGIVRRGRKTVEEIRQQSDLIVLDKDERRSREAVARGIDLELDDVFVQPGHLES